MAAPREPAPALSSRRAAPSSDTGPGEIIGDFVRGKEIGKGSFATVFLAKHRKKRSYAAVKAVQMSKLTRKLKDNLESEVRILKSLQHPHIVALFLCEEKPMYIYLVMEYCKLSDLAQFMKKRTTLHQFPETSDIFRKYPNPEHGGLHEVLARHFLKQIASALEYLRNRNFIHRDIKPQNLLLNPSPVAMAKQSAEDLPLAASENSLTPAVGVPSLPMLKIADFGFARHLPSTSMAETLCGSPLYMAPEILRYEKYDARADLWSTGTVLHEMVVGKPPFRASNHVELLRRIEKANDQILFDNKNITISRGMKDCIRKLLKKSPLDRVSYEDFFADPVVTGPIPGLVDEDQIETNTLKSETESDAPVSELSRRMGKQVAASAASEAETTRPRLQERGLQDEVQRSPSRQDRNSDERQRGDDENLRRRHSGSQNKAEPRDIPRKSSTRDQRRPSIVPHATAPGRQELHQAQPPVARMERRPSRASPLAGRPMIQEESNNEAENARQAERERRDEALAFEKEYVVVEKRAVEVNAFADEMAVNAQPPHQGAMIRRATTQGQPTFTTGAQHSNARQQGVHTRIGSIERRYGGQTLHTYIQKVVNAGAARAGFSPPWQTGQSPPNNVYSAFPTYPTPQAPLALGDGNESKRQADEDTKIARTMEDAAHRSDVIYGFAEVKFQQIFPPTPSAKEGLGIQQIGGEGQTQQAGDDEEEDRITTNMMLVGVCEEALVLYVKTLAILAKTIDLAGYWWGKQQKRNNGEVTREATEGSSPKSTTPAAEISTRMNNLVQWSRNRFNECFEKCEIVGRKLLESQKRLPEDHPGHPQNHSSSGGSGTVNASTDPIQITSGITAEKLMFERAVEMSRAAAVTELLGTDLPDCEISYQTAVMLLEGVLESDDEPLIRRPSKMREKADDEIINGMETEDRATVVRLIEGNRHRLHTIRKKIAHAQTTTKRGSVSGSSGKGGGSAAAGTPPR
ncbi:hypothetical protein MBLNU230_g5881t1 [Neophaeotheca triangularis]